MTDHRIRILVLCTGNSCRSQMAEGYIRHYMKGRADVFSAGIEAHGVDPRAIAVMREDGVDIAHHTSKTLDLFEGQAFDHVLTVCDNAQETCPVFPARHREHHGFPDPAKAVGTEAEIMQAFRQVRDMIKTRCRDFARSHS